MAIAVTEVRLGSDAELIDFCPTKFPLVIRHSDIVSPDVASSEFVDTGALYRIPLSYVKIPFPSIPVNDAHLLNGAIPTSFMPFPSAALTRFSQLSNA